MPDTTGGQAVYVALVLALCVVLAVATRERLTLWSILLGAGGFVGAYELTYAAAPPEIASTSISTATQLLLTAAVGFLAASLLPADGARVQPAARRSTRQDKDANNTDANNKLDDLMMEKAK